MQHRGHPIPQGRPSPKSDQWWSVEPRYSGWTKEDYESHGILFIAPMTAKEVDEDKLEELWKDKRYVAEEKLDGTRALMHMFSDGNRIFSRRVSVRSDWLCENSDNVPHLRDMIIPSLDMTVLDGEMRVDGKEFKDVSSLFTCLPDEAIARQVTGGFVTFHVFDLIYYRGKNLQDEPLHRRRELLEQAVKEIQKIYPFGIKLVEQVTENKKEYYEHIIANGGEGVMLKDIYGDYRQARGRQYQKVKKKLTREVICMGFTEPTKEYNGKFPNDQWEYWGTQDGMRLRTDIANTQSASELLRQGYTPVTKHWYDDVVGNALFGVVITEDELAHLKAVYPQKTYITERVALRNSSGGFTPVRVLHIGECSGFTDEERKSIKDSIRKGGGNIYLHNVMEVECNEIFKDTGKLRHPRYLRWRSDKNAIDCKWKDHVEG